MTSIRNFVMVFVIGIVACKEQNKKKQESVQHSKIELSSVELSNLDGIPISMEQYKGKTVFINFWATWCGPCLKEMPSIEKAMEILKDKNIEFLFASDEPVDVIEKFKKENNYSFNYVRILNQEELNIMALPTTFIFSSKGKLVFSEPGLSYWDRNENIDILLNAIK